MPRGLFGMTDMGWTPAAQLATQNLQGSANSYAAMDKAINQTQTTKYKGGGSLFGDILGGLGTIGGLAIGGYKAWKMPTPTN